jgi:hypothetical protein
VLTAEVLLCCAVLLQHLLEDAGIGYTGVTADYALACCNRIALHKVSMTLMRPLCDVHK